MLKINVVIFFLVFATVVGANSIIDTENYRALTSDERSFRVGEPIVILVVESTRAQSSTGTEVNRNFGFGVDANRNNEWTYTGDATLNRQREGDGKTGRTGTATTTVSAIIEEVLPNGVLRIRGEHSLMINDENQKIRLSGQVRGQDISKENTISSHRIANANIEIIGDGSISEADRRGLFAWIFGWL